MDGNRIARGFGHFEVRGREIIIHWFIDVLVSFKSAEELISSDVVFCFYGLGRKHLTNCEIAPRIH